MSPVRCLCSPIDWAYQSTHLHAHSHDGGPMRASDHCFRGTALMLMSASGSPKTKGACDGVDESQRQEHCIVDVVETLGNVSVRSHGRRCGAGGLSKPDLMQVIVVSVRQHARCTSGMSKKGSHFALVKVRRIGSGGVNGLSVVRFAIIIHGSVVLQSRSQ
ncbi:hypothetical protein LX32DRAFT_391283 [Colletotrichum zoysiae]|uniref:Uncharacterized protein n=1 Tax=Colletotrichum zoysiae TaxID=1216348 RepID=A0AAD9M4I8_9PEZI|nr:hypothetical protein LX32DRAFT_391283 [Colletotrichum zoysiae]